MTMTPPELHSEQGQTDWSSGTLGSLEHATTVLEVSHQLENKALIQKFKTISSRYCRAVPVLHSPALGRACAHD